MSRGPGSVERAIEEAFVASPSAIFMTDELVRIAYPGVNRLEKKHRVAVLRAAYKVAGRLWWRGHRQEQYGGQIVFYNVCDVRSYALGRLRSDWLNNQKTTAELAASLEPGGKHHSSVVPGGAWRRHVDIAILQRAGRAEDADFEMCALRAAVLQRYG